MLLMTKAQAAEQNIKLYVFVRIFAKRVFLPLSAIYFVSVSGLSIEEIGLLGAFSAGVGMLLDIPTGYFSDRYGKAFSIRIAGLLNALGTLIFVLIQNKTGVFLGIFVEAVGYAFLHGASEAIMHDSLEVLGRPEEYTKVSSRAQSKSLLINVAIIALVPMTYAFDERLPFLIGTVAYLSLAYVGFRMMDVHPHEYPVLKKPSVKLSQIKNHTNLIWFGIIFGLFAAIYTAPSDLRNLALEDYGANPELIGWFFALGSLAGAGIGYFVHRLKAMPIWKYAIIDGIIQVSSLAAYAFGSLPIAVGGFVISMSFWRYRKIVYQDYLLSKYKTKLKATILSTLNNAEQVHRIWLPIAAAAIIAEYGNKTGFAIFAVAAAVVTVPFIISVVGMLGGGEEGQPISSQR